MAYSAHRQPSSLTLVVFWLFSLLLVWASAFVAVQRSAGIGRMPLLDDHALLYSSLSLGAFALLVNLAVWMWTGGRRARLDIVRFNLIFVGGVITSFAALAWLAMSSGLETGPEYAFALYIFFAMLAAMAFFIWALAFLLPAQPSNGQLFWLLATLGVALAVCIATLGDHTYRIPHPNKGMVFFDRALLYSLIIGCLSLVLAILALAVEYISLFSIKGGRYNKRFVMGFAFWLASLALILFVESGLVPIFSRQFKSALLLPMALMPVLVLILANISHWRRDKNNQNLLALAGLHGQMIGAIFLWVATSFAGLVLLDDPHPLTHKSRYWPGLIIFLIGFVWLMLGLRLLQPAKLQPGQFLFAALLGFITLVAFLTVQGMQLPDFGSYRIHHLIEQLSAFIIWPLALLFLIALVMGWRAKEKIDDNKVDDNKREFVKPGSIMRHTPGMIILFLVLWVACAIISSTSTALWRVLANLVPLATITLLVGYKNATYWLAGVANRAIAWDLARLNSLAVALVILGLVFITIIYVSINGAIWGKLPLLVPMLVFSSIAMLLLAASMFINNRTKLWHVILAAFPAIPVLIFCFSVASTHGARNALKGYDPMKTSGDQAIWAALFLTLLYLASLWAAWRDGRR